jgi:2-(1,2-epoxy-1,2-dihydrophenyl)acetyl-CoA isomerase
MERYVLESVEDGVAVITLNRPERLNAMNSELMDQLLEAVRRAEADAEVGCVVLTGAGRGFCAGGDLKGKAEHIAAEALLPPDERTRPQTAQARITRLRHLMEAARLLHDMPKPTIAMVNGPCAGAGFSLAGACDLRIAGTSALFTSAFAKAGMSGDFGGSWFWTRVLGAGKARELYLLSEKLNAEQALQYGLVHRVVSDAELREETMRLARSLADGPRYAYRYIKRNLAAAEEGTLEEVFDLEATTMTLSAYEVDEQKRLAEERERFAAGRGGLHEAAR